uniref:WAT1-related protein n=1 Tax=Oryza punctata TaxID=4537 RepID=A0A0E0KQK2_ORYPU
MSSALARPVASLSGSALGLRVVVGGRGMGRPEAARAAVAAMVSLQLLFSALQIFIKLALNDGMDARVLVAYRFMFAATFLCPIAFLLERVFDNPFLGLNIELMLISSLTNIISELLAVTVEETTTSNHEGGAATILVRVVWDHVDLEAITIELVMKIVVPSVLVLKRFLEHNHE